MEVGLLSLQLGWGITQDLRPPLSAGNLETACLDGQKDSLSLTSYLALYQYLGPSLTPGSSLSHEGTVRGPVLAETGGEDEGDPTSAFSALGL